MLARAAALIVLAFAAAESPCLLEFTTDAFSIKYPAAYVVYTERPTHNDACYPSGERYPRPVAGYGWEDQHPLSKMSLVCIGYPHGAFPATTFTDAALQAMEITNLQTTADCESFAPPSGLPSQQSSHSLHNDVHRETIGGTRFLVGSFGGVAMTHVSVRKVYRTFQHGRCYEFSTNVEYGDYAGDSGTMQLFTAAQQRRVLDELKEILLTLRFRDR